MLNEFDYQNDPDCEKINDRMITVQNYYIIYWKISFRIQV